VLPDGNGPDLVAGLRREHAELKVVFMSGHDPDKLADYGIDFDSPDLMRKPFSPAVLLERVGRAFNVRYG
jgi:DNA-binding response OmpR family regulator